MTWCGSLVVNGMLISDLINLFRRREDVTLSDKAVSLIFKIATFAFRFFDGTLLPSLSSCLYVHTPSRILRSSSDGKKTLSCGRWKLKGFDRMSFSLQMPLFWNNCPPHNRHSSSLSQFKTSLKAFISTSAFSELP